MKTNATLRFRYCLLLLLTATGLFAQDGVTLSNYKAQAGPAGSATLTIDIRWAPPAGGKVWSDTVWVFADYNNAGTMTRLPLAPGATLANPSWSVASVIEEPGNPNGVWVAGNARSAGSFSATLQMVTTCRDARPCVPTGVCVYAINYPPAGRYTAHNQIHFTGTPPFYVTYNDGGNTVVQNSLAKPFTVPAGKTVASFYDASLAPGTLLCKPPVVQTLTASATGYCVGSPGVTLALSGTDEGAVYQLYKNDSEYLRLTGTGSAMTFTNAATKGAYRVSVLAGAFCEKPMGALVVKEHPLPNNPTVTAGSRCGAGTVQLSATSPDAVIDWYNVPTGGSVLPDGTGVSPFTTPSLTATTTFYAEARFTSTGCMSSSRTAVTATLQGHSTGSTVDFTAFDPCPGYTPGATASTWTLVDRRESNNVQSYKVRLMHDGRYWMVQDMKFGNKCNKTDFFGSVDLDQTGKITSLTDKTYYGDCRNNTQPGAGYLYDWAAAIQRAGAYYHGSSDVGCYGIGSGTSGTNPGACRGVCPEGWHIPTGDLSGEFYALHNAAGRNCSTPNDGCWDAGSIWEGVSGGYCNSSGTLYGQGSHAIYWSSTYNNTYAYILHFSSGTTLPGTNTFAKYYGASVRCVRNY
ncbi:MAG: hypothetical protein LBT49_04955 [Prevotellaceae bacterium]|nr:hypothetical protein [Prevotellaceae bacterium]